MYGSLDISTSGMIAQRTRLTVASANIANADVVYDSAGRVNPYRRRHAIFAPGNSGASDPFARRLGVHVAKIHIDEGAVRLRRDPDNPAAFRGGPNAGYVPVPDINPVMEQVNGMEALRAYEANVVAAEATKTMLAQALRLLA